MRRILYVNASGDFYGGAERCLLNLTAALERAEFTPLVVLPFRGQLYDELRGRGIDVRVMPLGIFRVRGELYPPALFGRLAEVLPAALRLAALARREGVALIHSNSSAVLAGALAARIAGVPHVWHVREIILRQQLLWAVMRRLIPRLSDRIICVSRAVRDHLGALSPDDERKTRVIYDGVDVAALTPGPSPIHGRGAGGEGQNGLTVGMVARITPVKGHEAFLRAARQIVASPAGAAPHTRFVVVGGCLPQYEAFRLSLLQLRHELGLDSALVFAGYLPERVPEIVRSFDVSVLPTTAREWREGLGQVILEAMALGKPVVATRSGGPSEVVMDGVTGYLVPTGDIDEMAAAILRLLNDEGLRLRMGRAGRERVVQHFSLARGVEAIQSLYREMIS
ncbi:MAG: glycosyltransferase family 4 protein [Chloroflexi bacterium]|nr:glycosyltransferase family 4 protein [Chloroflexota bacterium]